MNISKEILVIDVNIIIHLEKVNLLDELARDKNIRIVDLVFYQEYQYKPNLVSDKLNKLAIITLDEKEVKEAINMNLNNKRNSIFDYFSYIAARDNNYALLTDDWKLKKWSPNGINIYGAIWYVQKLRAENVIDDLRLKEIYTAWLYDPTVFLPSEILIELLAQLDI